MVRFPDEYVDTPFDDKDMIDSRIWDKAWSDARASGIDGFTVGFKPSTHPGPIHWEMYCDMCGKLITSGNKIMPREHDKPDFCIDCTKHMDEARNERLFNSIWYYEI